MTSHVAQRPVRRTIGPTQERNRKKPAGLVRLLRGGSCQEEEGIPRRPVSRSHLPYLPSPWAWAPEHLCCAEKAPTAPCARFVFDSLSHRIFNFYLRFLPRGRAPASRSAQQAEPGEAISPRMSSLRPERAHSRRLPGGCRPVLPGLGDCISAHLRRDLIAALLSPGPLLGISLTSSPCPEGLIGLLCLSRGTGSVRQLPTAA